MSLADAGQTGLELDRLAFVLRKRAEHEIPGIYFASLSARTVVYKGMLTAPQLPKFFVDLSDPLFESGLVLAHARFSTNTFPSWPLAHPYRYVAHNGEFNTVQGNRNWMRTREAMLRSKLVPGDLSRIFPIVTPGGSDSMSFDEVLELLHLSGRSLPHAVLMMIPEAWENKQDISPAAAGLLPVPRLHDGALGRPCSRRVHRRRRSSVPNSTGTGSGRCVIGLPTMTS